MSNDLMTPNVDPALLALTQSAEFQELLQKDLQDQRAHMAGNRLPFRALKMPAQGQKMFSFEVEPGVSHQFPHFIGHVIHIQYYRQYWNNKALLCQSNNDSVASASNVLYPNRKCIECPDGNFGTDAEGKSVKPKCSRKARLFILPCQFNPKDKTFAHTYPVNDSGQLQIAEEASEPIMLEVPPTSLKGLSQYFQACETYAQAPMPFSAFVSLFTLVEATSPSGTYSKLVINPLRVVPVVGLKYRNYIMEHHKIKELTLEDVVSGEEEVVAPPIAGAGAPVPPPVATIPVAPAAPAFVMPAAPVAPVTAAPVIPTVPVDDTPNLFDQPSLQPVAPPQTAAPVTPMTSTATAAAPVQTTSAPPPWLTGGK